MNELKRLLPYIKKYKARMLLGFLFVTISNICSTYLPRVVGNIVDTVQKKNFDMNLIYESIVIIVALTAGSGLFMFLTRQTIIVVSRLIEYDLRKDFVNAVERQSMNFFNKNSTGSLMAYATNDIPAAREFLGPAIMYAANTITTFSFALYFMLNLNPTITLIALLPLPVIAVATYNIGKKVHIAFKNVQEQFSNLTTQAQETFSGIRVVRSYVREDYESDRFSVLSGEYVTRNLRLARYQAITMPILMVLVGLSQVIVLGYGGWQIINGHATLGTLTQFFIYINLLIWPVAAIGWITNLIQRAAASAARLGKIMEQSPEIVDSPDVNHNITELNGEIKFCDASLKYSPELPYVLENINLNIKKGHSLGIVGSVGSGKSSFVNLIPRLYELSEGKIFIDDYEITEIPINTLRNNIAVVSQEPFLFSASISDNIRFGKPGAAMDEIIEISKASFLHDDVLSFPEKYDTMLGERGITLSGGQKQRLAIARALLKNAPILILDDALSAIDAQTEDRILQSIKKYMIGRTTIIISHRISTVKDLDKIIFLENGKIVEKGTHAGLVSLSGKYNEIYSYQQLQAEIEQL